MRSLYPEITPYRVFSLNVGDGHHLHVAECGRSDGAPVLFLHGGPGMGYGADAARLFDPEHYRVVLFDQRGAARSAPLGAVEHNTTAHLVSDIERIRISLGLERWIVCGGSWGSALALAYARSCPKAVTGLILRGIFLGTRAEDTWQYQAGAHAHLPDDWKAFETGVPYNERHDLIGAYHRRVMSADPAVHAPAARSFAIWAARTNTIAPDPEEAALLTQDWLLPFVLAGVRIATHYAVNGSFLDDAPLLRSVGVLRAIPAVIIHGRQDYACPVSSAEALAEALPGARVELIDGAGHSLKDPLIRSAVVMASDAFRDL